MIFLSRSHTIKKNLTNVPVLAIFRLNELLLFGAVLL